MNSIELMRKDLYAAIENGDGQKILDLSRRLDVEIVEYLKISKMKKHKSPETLIKLSITA